MFPSLPPDVVGAIGQAIPVEQAAADILLLARDTCLAGEALVIEFEKASLLPK